MGRIKASLVKLIGQKSTQQSVIDRINAHYEKYNELLKKNEAILEMMAGPGWQDFTQVMRDTLERDGRELPNQVLTMAASGDCQALVTSVRMLDHRKFLGLANAIERERGSDVARSQEQFRAALKEQGD
ncbi:MAG: hypothetical protein ACYTBZ_31170 [Planctomycetota bacterium]|jgi:hypothetical protein